MTLLRNVTTTADGFTYCYENATVYYVAPDSLCNGQAAGIEVGTLDDVTDDVAADLALDAVPIARCALASDGFHSTPWGKAYIACGR